MGGSRWPLLSPTNYGSGRRRTRVLPQWPVNAIAVPSTIPTELPPSRCSDSACRSCGNPDDERVPIVEAETLVENDKNPRPSSKKMEIPAAGGFVQQVGCRLQTFRRFPADVDQGRVTIPREDECGIGLSDVEVHDPQGPVESPAGEDETGGRGRSHRSQSGRLHR